MSVEMKKCKECGKLFVPRNSRQQYCDELHYRPCPVCGKLVEAKYLSDPARCCSSKCRKELGEMRKNNVTPRFEGVEFDYSKVDEGKVSIEPEVVPAAHEKHDDGQNIQSETVETLERIESNETAEVDDEYERTVSSSTISGKYKGRSVLGFQHGHIYGLQIEPPNGKNSFVYQVNAVYDFTTHQVVDLMIPLSSETSITQYFEYHK